MQVGISNNVNFGVKYLFPPFERKLLKENGIQLRQYLGLAKNATIEQCEQALSLDLSRNSALDELDRLAARKR